MNRKMSFVAVFSAACILCLTEASRAVLAGPALSVTTARLTVTISWTEVEGADGYLFYYAPYPAADPIGELDVGPQTGPFVLELWPEAAFYIAVRGYGAGGPGEFSNIESFSLPLVPLHRDDVNPDCLDGCYDACSAAGGGVEPCMIECEYECGSRAYVVIEKTFYSHSVVPGYSDATLDARAKIYLLLNPTGVEDAYTVDFAEIHSLSVNGVTYYSDRVERCSGSQPGLIPPTGSILRVYADREQGVLSRAVIPAVGVTAVLCCDGQCGEWGVLSGVERQVIQAVGGTAVTTVHSGFVGEFWEVNLPVSNGSARLTYTWSLYTQD